MLSRAMMFAAAAAGLVAAPLLAPPAHAQVVLTQATAPIPMAMPETPSSTYLVPIVIGVVAGALVWPLLLPAETVAVGAVAAAPGMPAVVDVAAVPAPGVWGWRSVLAAPAVAGGIIGGLLGYAVAR